MSSVLLTHSYFLHLDPKQEEAGNAYPPLGTLYAAACLREQGFAVSLFDSMLAGNPNEIKPYLENGKPDFVVIYDDGFNYLTKMCLTNMREAAFSMIQLAKSKDIPVIISSSDSTDHFEIYLDKGVDFVILGEGEMTLSDLLAALKSEGEVDQIQGIAYRKSGATINAGKRPVMRDLDTLPLPAWDMVDFNAYRQRWQKKAGYFSLNLVTTRGCTYKCNWCAKPIFGNRYNARTPAHVVEELRFLIQEQQVDHIWFCDDIFGLKPGWLVEFAKLVTEAGLKFRFKIQSRADLMVVEPSVKALAEAGCDTVWLGAESGSQKILDAMEKGTSLDQIYKSRQMLKQNGIKTAFFLQFGYPGETMEDIKATINMVLETMPDDIGISVTYPLPGTKLYENVKSQLVSKTNWKDSDELAMMFQNTFPQPFYKELQRYMHTVYRREKSILAAKKLFLSPLHASFSQIKTAMTGFYHVPSAILKHRKLRSFKLQ
jgi:anaerobic magnesium-protoporphyrin IX monomethyl ester cyclase